MGQMAEQGIMRQGTMRFLFVVIVAFVLVQVAWWVVFQQGYVDAVTERVLSSWRLDAEAANHLGAAGVADTVALLTRYPHLAVRPDGAFVVDAVQEAEFIQAQRRHVRMFVAEGLGFAAIVLFALYLINRRLTAERELKLQQQNFVSAITHEFKTPISSLRLLIETALYRNLDGERMRSYLTKMQGELDRLEQSSDMVLASTRREQAQEPVTLLPLELNAVVRDFLERNRGGFETRGAAISVEYHPEALPVSLDLAAFDMVLGNLIDNAVKYTPAGSKPVIIRLVAEEHLVKLHVDDEGVGIPATEAGKVFDRFYRVGSELVRTAPGVGLGLYLVRSSAEAMNGWIRHQPRSDSERGTRFTLTLPRRTLTANAEIGRLEGRPA